MALDFFFVSWVILILSASIIHTLKNELLKRNDIFFHKRVLPYELILKVTCILSSHVCPQF